jgi:hypothetical protein
MASVQRSSGESSGVTAAVVMTPAASRGVQDIVEPRHVVGAHLEDRGGGKRQQRGIRPDPAHAGRQVEIAQSRGQAGQQEGDEHPQPGCCAESQANGDPEERFHHVTFQSPRFLAGGQTGPGEDTHAQLFSFS